MNVGIPFKRTAEGVENTDKTRDKFKIAAFGTGIHCTTESGVTTVKHLVNVINDGLTRM